MITAPLRHARLAASLCRCGFITDDFVARHSHLLLLQAQAHQRLFHLSRRKLQDTFPNHYETLQLAPSATGPQIKKQFYALSKKYHPDINRAPEASERFVAISEAYHVLGSSDKKGKYDRDFQRHHHHGGHGGTRHGSHHSSSTRGPVGSRPASGLSKRRSQFRGPPPSFYAQGGYGASGAKRQRAQQEADAQSSQRQQSVDPNRPGGLGSQPGYKGTGGFSPGDGAGYHPEPDLPYFNKEGHRRTHEGLSARRERMDGGGQSQVDPYAQQGSMMANFLMVSAAVALATVFATAVTGFVTSAASTGKGRKRGDG